MKRVSRLFIIICILSFTQPSKITASTPGEIYSVNTRGDEGDSDLSDGICWNGIGEECTLRAAIEQANYDPNTADTILFNIPSVMVLSKVISIDTALPDLSTPMTIQGPNISDGTKIVLDGQGFAFTGLTISSDDVLLDTISLSHFGDYGIIIEDAESVSVLNCVIGKFMFLPIFSGNGSHGIYMNNSSGVLIQDNLINDNGGDGIRIFGGGENVILGNMIGVEITGTTAEPNAGNGISIINSNSNNIGGNTEEERNIISGNTQNGILIEGSALSNILTGNYIGADLTGTMMIPNQMNGIEITNASDTQVGGVGDGEGNLIFGNIGDGVAVKLDSFSNSIIGNAIYMNEGLGINLINAGEGTSSVTHNDAGDFDSGPNHLQNFPIIYDFTYSPAETSITVIGALISSPSATYILHFYGNDICDLSGYGEGQVFLGTGQVMTSGSGSVGFSFELPADENYDCITATATDFDGNTSEFSKCDTPQFITFIPLMVK